MKRHRKQKSILDSVKFRGFISGKITEIAFEFYMSLNRHHKV